MRTFCLEASSLGRIALLNVTPERNASRCLLQRQPHYGTKHIDYMARTRQISPADPGERTVLDYSIRAQQNGPFVCICG